MAFLVTLRPEPAMISPFSQHMKPKRQGADSLYQFQVECETGNLAERVGFEPTVRGYRTPDFESGTFDHSATSPNR